MTWYCNNEEVTEVPSKVVGFVYLITSLVDGRKYLGKKKATFKKTAIKTVKLKNGEKRKKKIRSEIPSDWMDYYGSSAELTKEVETHGKDKFKREILCWCYTLTELGYMEAKYQFDTDCLRKPTEYFNSWIFLRVRRSGLVKTVL